jgi:hypothetical protein
MEGRMIITTSDFIAGNCSTLENPAILKESYGN